MAARVSPLKMATGILRDIYRGVGYWDALKISETERRRIETLVTDHYLARLRDITPEHFAAFESRPIRRYHESCHLIDHTSSWLPDIRHLPKDAVTEICRMNLFRALREAVGPFELIDRQSQGWPEMNWRLVRPDAPGDVQGLHADGWFWDVLELEIPPGVDRLKGWVAICSEPSVNGLRVIPGSHADGSITYHSAVDNNGNLRPIIDQGEDELDVRLLECAPGDVVVFHDRLIHGGSHNRGRECRISIEFTMLVEPPQG